MDVVNIIGMKNVNFEDNSGRRVDGTSFFFTMPMEGNGAIGQMAGKMFLTNEKCGRLNYVPRVGDTVKVYYNRYGKPEEFALYDAEEF